MMPSIEDVMNALMAETAVAGSKTVLPNALYTDAGDEAFHSAFRETRELIRQRDELIKLFPANEDALRGQLVLDTHLGSGSHAIAAHYFGAHLTACEIDRGYYTAAMQRIECETAQAALAIAEIPAHATSEMDFSKNSDA